MGNALIADDDPDILDIVRAVLAREGHHVVAVTNGVDAVDRLRSQTFDLAVLDVQMPGMTGLEVLEKTDGMDPPRPPVIMLSGLTSFQDRQRGLDAGASDYLAKPFRIREFLDVVNAHLSRSRAAE